MGWTCAQKPKPTTAGSDGIQHNWRKKPFERPTTVGNILSKNRIFGKGTKLEYFGWRILVVRCVDFAVQAE